MAAEALFGNVEQLLERVPRLTRSETGPPDPCQSLSTEDVERVWVGIASTGDDALEDLRPFSDELARLSALRLLVRPPHEHVRVFGLDPIVVWSDGSRLTEKVLSQPDVAGLHL